MSIGTPLLPPDKAAIHVSVEIARERAHVWRCLTETERLRRWWNPEVVLDPQPGGLFEEPWRDAEGRTVLTRGRVLRAEAPALLALSWADEDWNATTELRIALSGEDASTRLDLSHGGWQAFPPADRAALVAHHEAGWRRHLYALKGYAEGSG